MNNNKSLDNCDNQGTADEKKEQWREVVGYEVLYLVSNMGRIYSVRQKKILRPSASKKTHYLHVELHRADGTHITARVHRVVAEAWCPGKAHGLEVEHIDTNRQNNRADNLRWTTHKDNCRNILTRAKMAGVAILQQDMDGHTIARYASQQQAAEVTGIQQSSISLVCRGIRHTAGGYIWKFEEEE